jgi:2-polyprenyl-6-methoxyphenol hydroxylase-like FAD-dependent oxidoreductase
MALTDAQALADALGPRWSGDSIDLDAAAQRYEKRQWPINQRLVNGSHWLAKVYALRGPVWTWAKLLGVMALARPLTRRLTRPVLDRFILEAR